MYSLRMPSRTKILTENESCSDAKLRFEEKDGKIQVFLQAEASKPRFVELFWETKFEKDALFLGDAWERTYANIGWKPIKNLTSMPWYFLCRETERITAVGVMTGAASFVSFSVTSTYVKALIDVRCGGVGVELGGRELLAAEFISLEYTSSPFDALCDFCGKMCPNPLLPPRAVYGGNNWYYAYGESSREEILKDATYQSKLAEGLANRPFMVIDDGWQIKKCAGPWIPNKKFGDMQEIASEMKRCGVKPGIWVRLLRDDVSYIPDDWRLESHGGSVNMLDPSKPEVLEHISDIVKQFVSWGYELIKHDFSTYDIIGKWGFKAGEYFADDGWSFADRSRTTAEIILSLYKTILNAAGNSLVLGCNTVSHLGAGLVHLSRIGDDTSGYDWDRTYRYGVNTLAFRLAHHNRFYAVDADCVGFKGIPWENNEQWLKLLALSGTPLFVSCPKDALSENEFAVMKDAYRHAAVQKDTLQPIDWFESATPQKWKLNGKEVLEFNWISNDQE